MFCIRNNAYNVVLDHMSLSWGQHGSISINAWSGDAPYNVAILDTIVAENLTKRLTPYATGSVRRQASGRRSTSARPTCA